MINKIAAGGTAGSTEEYTTGITNPALGDTLQSLTGEGFLAKFFPALIGWLITGGVTTFFFMLLWGALEWIRSGGDKAALESARGRITNALIGIVILFSVFAIAKLIETFFSINILTIDIGPLKIE